jgi:hypothetical protein
VFSVRYDLNLIQAVSGLRNLIFTYTRTYVKILININIIYNITLLIINTVIITMLRAGGSGVRITLGARNVSLLQNVQAGSGAHPASYSMGTGILS